MIPSAKARLCRYALRGKVSLEYNYRATEPLVWFIEIKKSRYIIFQSTKLDRKGLFLLHAGHVLTYMLREQSTVYAIQWTLTGPEGLMTLRSQGDVNY